MAKRNVDTKAVPPGESKDVLNDNVRGQKDFEYDLKTGKEKDLYSFKILGYIVIGLHIVKHAKHVGDNLHEMCQFF